MAFLRMRRPPLKGGNFALPQNHEKSLSSDDNDKRRRRIPLWKRLVCAVALVVAALLAAKPLFSDWFQEINFILHHASAVADYLLLKRRQNANDKIIYFLHLSKCGGTSMMEAAKESGLTVPIRNGLVQRDWRCCGNEDTIAAQEEYALSSRFDFVSNEGDMYDAMDTTHYDYVVTLRDSKTRYKSMWLQWQRDPILFFLGHMNFTQFWQWFYEDNFMFRKICGSKCRGVPKYHLSRDTFNYTLNRLTKFDSVLFLEDYDRSYAKFAHKHKWTAQPKKVRLSSSLGVSTGDFADEEDEWDFHMSALDDALYEFAQRLDRGDPNPYRISQMRMQNVNIYFSDTDKIGSKEIQQ